MSATLVPSSSAEEQAQRTETEPTATRTGNVVGRLRAPLPSQAPERERRDEDVRAPAPEAPVSGRLHVLNRDYVLVLSTGLRVASSVLNLMFFFVFAFLWLAFGTLLIVNQSVLDTVWQHLLDLPLILQVAVWILVLPITVGLWIWESGWTLWLRLTLVVIVGVGWTAAMFPRSSAKPEGTPDVTRGWHQVPHGTNQ